MRRHILLYSVTFFFTTGLLAHTCAVSVDELKGQYTGGCKKGKAEGAGTAIGINSYTVQG